MKNVKSAALILSALVTCTAISAADAQTHEPTHASQREAIAQTAQPQTAEEPQAAPIDFEPAEQERIEELLELTDADSLSTQVMEQLVGQFRQLAPEVPDIWWDGFIEKALESDINSLLVPIYQRNYSAEEIEGLIAFYQSPVGQSVLAKTTIVTQESIEVGQAWGIELAEELLAELEADGYEFPVEEF